MQQSTWFYNCKSEGKAKNEETEPSGSNDSGLTMMEREESSRRGLLGMENSPRVTQELEFLRGRNPTYSRRVRSNSAPQRLRWSYSGSRDPSRQVGSRGPDEENKSPPRTKTRYASQKSASHVIAHRGRENTKDEKKGKPEPDIFELLELLHIEMTSSQRLNVETSDTGLLETAVGADETDSLLEDGSRGDDAGINIQFGDPSIGEPEGEGVFDSNQSSPTEESGIDKIVRNLLRISGEIETDEGFRDLAMHVTETLEDERVLSDYPSFSSTMDSLLDQYYDQTSLSNATPFKKMLFISLVNMLFIRRLRERTSQFLSTMVDYATQYIASFLPVAMIRRSSSVMSDLCHREASTSSAGSTSASRSRLSSVGATSTSGVEENNASGLNFLGRRETGITRGTTADSSDIYSSTFDLDLSSISATSTGASSTGVTTSDRYSNDSSAGPGLTPQTYSNSFSGFGGSGLLGTTSNSNHSSRRDSLHAILSPPLPLTSNLYGATTSSQVPQQNKMNSYYASARNDHRKTSSSCGVAGPTSASMTQTGRDIPTRRLHHGRPMTSSSDVTPVKRGGEDERTSSFQSQFFSTAKENASGSALGDNYKGPQGNAAKQGSSQNVVRKKERKPQKTKLTESVSYDFAPVRRKESDVDSAFCTEEDCFTFPSFDSSVDLHPGDNRMENFMAQASRHGGFNTSQVRSGFGLGPGSQHPNQRTRVSMPATCLSQTREEYRQAAIRRRRIFGMQGRLPSFSDEMTAAFTAVHGASFGAMEETLARSVPNDGFASNFHSRASRTASAGSSSDQWAKSVHVTLTFFILAAMIRYRRS